MRAWRSELVYPHAGCGDGPQLVSALAQHFEMAVDQIEYRLQLYACSLGFEQRLRVTNRHAEVGATETFDLRERNTDHFSVSVDQRPS
jgi:hypothetical protein